MEPLQPFNNNMFHSKYIQNRQILIKDFEKQKDILIRIMLEGVKSTAEISLARAACSFVLAEIEYGNSYFKNIKPENN